MSLTFAPITDPNLRVNDLGTVYFIGIGGAGMSVIARMYHGAGVQVAGADAAANEVTAALSSLGVQVYQGHTQEQVHEAQTVVVSSAVRESNPELTYARAHGLRVLHRSQALALLMRDRRAVAVAGAHGKTSTSAMIAVGAQELGLDPSYAVGGSVITAAGPLPGGKLGLSDVLIAEADESDGTFMNYEPFIAVVTNVEADHLDHYGSVENFERAFISFASNIVPGGTLVACADDPGAMRTAQGHRASGGTVITYGQSAIADVQITDFIQVPGHVGVTCRVHLGELSNGTTVTMDLAVPGRHNALNATAALIVLVLLGADPDRSATALGQFLGTGRRFELRGTVADIQVIDDYAHHPTEVQALLAAARVAAGTGRVLTLFQPHLFSRTKTFTTEFAQALDAGEHTVLTSIYAAREDNDPTVSAEDIAKQMTAPVDYVEQRIEAARRIAQLAEPGDLILTVGAGDVTELGTVILAELEATSTQQPQLKETGSTGQSAGTPPRTVELGE